MLSDSGRYIVPQYKMIVTYDIRPATRERYYQFITSEMVPALQEMGLYMAEAWHTAYGMYPIRMASFIAEDRETIEDALASDRWQAIEDEFKGYVKNYSRAIVPYRKGFQFTEYVGS